MTNTFDLLIALTWAGSVLFIAFGVYRTGAPFLERAFVLLEARSAAGSAASVTAQRQAEPMPLDLMMMAQRLAPEEHLQWAADDALAVLREQYAESGDWNTVRQWAAVNLPSANGVHRVS